MGWFELQTNNPFIYCISLECKKERTNEGRKEGVGLDSLLYIF